MNTCARVILFIVEFWGKTSCENYTKTKIVSSVALNLADSFKYGSVFTRNAADIVATTKPKGVNLELICN